MKTLRGAEEAEARVWKEWSGEYFGEGFEWVMNTCVA